MENWKTGKLENWKTGKLENWKTGKLENWKTGKLENWKTGKLENWKTGKFLRVSIACQTFFSIHNVVIPESEARASWGSLTASRKLYEIPYSFLRQSME
ncbi:hypothetical protein [Vibrio neptunius]|uniref:hypothetical protein n=1 Tax=Vibrio neptunius TaxID=170651 RepID=UPI003CE5547F